MSSSKRKHSVYIIPTIDGLKVIALNLLLLIIGLVYANNYVLLFNFMLFCLFMSSMFYTHFNLNKLNLEFAQFDNLFCEEITNLKLRFSSSNSHGHYFIKALIKNNDFTFVENTSFSVSNNQKDIALSIQGHKRGETSVETLYIETEFPFNFFKCFTFFRLDQKLFISPTRKNLQLHREILMTEIGVCDLNDFMLKNYSPGDSLKRIDWKKFAQSQQMFTRHPATVIQAPVLLIIAPDQHLELQLQSVCFSVFHYHSLNIKYGLKIKDEVLILPDHSQEHLENCLEQLATYAA